MSEAETPGRKKLSFHPAGSGGRLSQSAAAFRGGTMLPVIDTTALLNMLVF